MGRNFYQEFRDQDIYTDTMSYGAYLIAKYAKQRRRNLITLSEYIHIRSAIEEQLFLI